MLVNCKPGCKEKKVTTEIKLDEKTDEAICSYCGEIIEVSSFTKRSLKSLGRVIKEPKNAFQFDCSTCDKKVGTIIKDSKLVGKDCSGNCNFNISSIMIRAMKLLQSKKDDSDE